MFTFQMSVYNIIPYISLRILVLGVQEAGKHLFLSF
jgi:hypothetical protein